MIIYCTGCQKDIEARLTDGKEHYPHRPDLYDLPFWKCDTCGNYIGCHYKTKNRTRPLGCIATPEIMAARRRIHAKLDPLWKNGLIDRRKAYDYISRRFGREYHTGDIRSREEADAVLAIVEQLRESMGLHKTKPRRDRDGM